MDTEKRLQSLLLVTVEEFQSNIASRGGGVADCVEKGICLKCTNNLVFDGAVWLADSLAKGDPRAAKPLHLKST